MVSRSEMSRLQEMLVSRRRELLDLRKSEKDAWEHLHDRSVEFEETAQGEELSEGLNQLSAQQQDELEAIDRALGEIETGRYGICDSCGRDISFKRLEAIPFTPLCIRCARRGSREAAPEEEEGLATPSGLSEFSTDYEGMDDEELEAAIGEKLQVDGRVDTEELDISCRDGVAFLEGLVPSETMHQILINILEDVMGLPDVVDRLQVERQVWEREDRVQDIRDETRSDEETLREGEGENEDVYESRRGGTPWVPPDEMVPEEED